MGKSGSRALRRKKGRQHQHQHQHQHQQQQQRVRSASSSSGQPAGYLHQPQYQPQYQQQRSNDAASFAQQSQQSRSCQDLQDERAGSELLRALFSFDGQVDGDLSFRKGDLLEVVEGGEEFWPLVRNLRTGASGYVPYNYVQVLDGSPHSLDCWFNVDRREAERNLLLPGHPAGCFLLRPCHQAADQAELTLSVRAEDADAGVRRVQVKHYMLRRDGAGAYYINPKLTFASLEQLLQHYQRQQDGLCCRLATACPRDWRPPAQLRDFEVNRQSLMKVKLLGQGSFGEVWQAKLNRLVDVAVKSMKPGTMNKEDFLDEAKLHYKLHHPRVVQLLGVCTMEEPIFIITEFMPNGALNQFLRADRELRRITFANMTDMMFQISDGMAYLSRPENNVVHRDLRAANILVGVSNVVKVSDFGLSRCLNEENQEVHIKFPVRWTAPEAAKTKTFTTKSDVWSFGVLMYEIVSRAEMPYKDMNNKDVIPRVIEGYRLPNPNECDGAECSSYLYDVMLHCWKANPEERPTFEDLRNIFESYGFDSQPEYGEVARRASNFSLISGKES